MLAYRLFEFQARKQLQQLREDATETPFGRQTWVLEDQLALRQQIAIYRLSSKRPQLGDSFPEAAPYRCVIFGGDTKFDTNVFGVVASATARDKTPA